MYLPEMWTISKSSPALIIPILKIASLAMPKIVLEMNVGGGQKGWKKLVSVAEGSIYAGVRGGGERNCNYTISGNTAVVSAKFGDVRVISRKFAKSRRSSSNVHVVGNNRLSSRFSAEVRKMTLKLQYRHFCREIRKTREK